MRVTVTGSNGLLGSALVRSLRADGHEVVRLVRREPSGADEARWDPRGGYVDPEALEGSDAVVHLAGAGVGDRPWTQGYKREIRESRILGTRALAKAVAGAEDGPKVFVSGSAVGFYGDTGDREVDEESPMGSGFLAELVRDWEAEAEAAGVRVVLPRTGIVLDGEGGLLAKVLPLFRLGLGGRLGDGRQWMSWISLPDHVAAMRFLLDSEISGPVNLVGPSPVVNAVFTKAVGNAVHRPTLMAVPKTALRVALREFADEGPLISQRVLPGRLDEAGFRFAHPDLNEALEAVL